MKILKKRIALLILPVIFLTILMTSCSSNDEAPANTSSSILGRWAFDKKSFTTNGVNTPDFDYENNNPGCALNDYLEFNDNGTLETGYYQPNCDVNPGIGNWAKTGSTIAITVPLDPEENKILELINLSSTEMKFRVDLTGTKGVEAGKVLFINFTMVKVN